MSQDLGGCGRNGDDNIFYPTAYGYNFHFSRQRFPPSSGKKDSAECTWIEAPQRARPCLDLQDIDRKPDYMEVMAETRECAAEKRLVQLFNDDVS